MSHDAAPTNEEERLIVTVVFETTERRNYFVPRHAMAKDLASVLGADATVSRAEQCRCFLVHKGRILNMDDPLEPLYVEGELVIYAVFKELTDEERRAANRMARRRERDEQEEEEELSDVPLADAEWPAFARRFGDPGEFNPLLNNFEDVARTHRVALALRHIFWFLVGTYFGFPVTVFVLCCARIRPSDVFWLIIGNVVAVALGWKSLRFW